MYDDKLAEAANHLSNDALENVKTWLTNDKYSAYRDEVLDLVDQKKWQQLEDSFFKILEFGTAGRRGSVGVGSNRINKITIGECAQALCAYASSLDEMAHEKGIVIAYDTRLTSPELSQYAARVCAANGFKTYLFDSFRATPELSFAVRHLGCVAGIVISASHNPPQDNGFKAYWSDGAQVTAPHDKGILDAAIQVSNINADINFDEAVSSGKIQIIESSVDQAYIKAVLDQSRSQNRDVELVYSPLHGTGQVSTLKALEAAGFNKIHTVNDQMTPDGNFPAVPNQKPNPEEREANAMAADLLLEKQADIAITNDPDADRIGVMVRQGKEVTYLNGNQTAILVADFLLSKLGSSESQDQDNYIVKTIVTTDGLDALASNYGVSIYNNLPIGFKYVGQIIRLNENTTKKFIIGAEESYGLLAGDYARDKDGAVAALLISELAAETKAQGQTLVDKLNEIYQKIGLYAETMKTEAYPGAEGFQTMQKIMSSLRADPPKSIGEHQVSALLDYSTLKKHLSSGEIEPIDAISSNILVLEFGDHRCRVTIRPSGTEPKLKFYAQWFKSDIANISDDKKQLEDFLDQLSTQLAKIALERV